jgi:hypothetical protein
MQSWQEQEALPRLSIYGPGGGSPGLPNPRGYRTMLRNVIFMFIAGL